MVPRSRKPLSFTYGHIEGFHMEITYILTFFGGVAADIARKVLIPQTEEWLERVVPFKRRARNVERNLLRLEVREKLEKLGHDPALARYVEEDAEEFWRRLDQRQEAQREALVELQTDRVLSEAATQAEMNQNAFDRLQEADTNLAKAIERLKRKAGLSENALVALDESQSAWEAYRCAQSRFDALALVEGGSMEPMLQASHAEDLTIDRILKIAALRKGMTHYDYG
ncbi:hypothetical protein CDZ96_24235 [Mameliella alba]|nr:hypothetical protein CDZ96_24235 [Mameliella alba]